LIHLPTLQPNLPLDFRIKLVSSQCLPHSPRLGAVAGNDSRCIAETTVRADGEAEILEWLSGGCQAAWFLSFLLRGPGALAVLEGILA
jgi:hypothetical protein